MPGFIPQGAADQSLGGAVGSVLRIRVQPRKAVPAVGKPVHPNGSFSPVSCQRARREAPDSKDGHFHCFFFGCSNGGNWSRLSEVQRAIYLAVGARAKKIEPDETDGYSLPYGMSTKRFNQSDFRQCFDANPSGRFVRVAWVATSELCEIVGYSKLEHV